MDDVTGKDPAFGIVLTRDGGEVGQHPIHEVGTSVTVTESASVQDGRINIVVLGRERFRVHHEDWSRGYLVGTVEWLTEMSGDPMKVATGKIAAISQMTDIATRIGQTLRLSRGESIAEILGVALPDDPTELAWFVAARMPLHLWERQHLLESPTTAELYVRLNHLMRRDLCLMSKVGVTVPIPEPGRARSRMN